MKGRAVLRLRQQPARCLAEGVLHRVVSLAAAARSGYAQGVALSLSVGPASLQSPARLWRRPTSTRGRCSAITFDAPSRLHAVRYKLAVDASLNAMGSPSKALVAFTDVVKDAKDGQEYTEAKMNGFPEAATGDRFERDEYRFLIMASKFQSLLGLS